MKQGKNEVAQFALHHVIQFNSVYLCQYLLVWLTYNFKHIETVVAKRNATYLLTSTYQFKT